MSQTDKTKGEGELELNLIHPAKQKCVFEQYCLLLFISFLGAVADVVSADDALLR